MRQKTATEFDSPNSVSQERRFVRHFCSSLSAEEIDMCKSASALAHQAQETLLDGLETLGQLQDIAEEYCDRQSQPAIGKLLAYLSEQARFMAHSAAEYRTAAQNVRRR